MFNAAQELRQRAKTQSKAIPDVIDTLQLMIVNFD
jgi:hypothetical protein